MVYSLGMTPTNQENARYTLTELADLAGVSPRTVRYYISQGLIAVDVAPGPGPKYDDSHLARIRLIKRLQAEHLPLAEIRHRLEGLSDQEVLTVAEEPVPPPPDSALEYIRSLSAPSHRPAPAPAAAVEAPRAIALYSRNFVAEPAVPASSSHQAPDQPARLERSQWERIDLAPDIELHVRRPLARQTAKQVDRLISIARDLFQKENPS